MCRAGQRYGYIILPELAVHFMQFISDFITTVQAVLQIIQQESLMAIFDLQGFCINVMMYLNFPSI